MTTYGGYSGYQRACKSLRSRGVPIDVPAAGILGPGTHQVELIKLVEADEFIEITVRKIGSNDEHRQRLYNAARAQHELFAAAFGSTRPAMGSRACITLDWQRGCYRVERSPEGYFAIIDGETVGGPYATMVELDRHAKESHVKRAYLQLAGR